MAGMESPLVPQAQLRGREHLSVEREPFLLAVQSEPPVVTAALFVAKQALHRGSFRYIAFSIGVLISMPPL